jgi:hypothetical protein
MPSLVILVPHRGDISLAWLEGLKRLRKPVDTAYEFASYVPLPEARTMLARRFLQSGAEWALWMDDDVIPPPDGLEKLMSHGLPLVTGLYPAKKKWGEQTLSAWVRAVDREGRTGYVAIGFDQPGRLVKVDVAGMGFLLMHRSVLAEKVPEPWFRWTWTEEGTSSKDATAQTSEDFFFFQRCASHGVELYADMEVLCAHIGTFKMTYVRRNGRVEGPVFTVPNDSREEFVA